MKAFPGHFPKLKKAVSQWTIQREITITILLTSLLPLILSNFYFYSRINSLYEDQTSVYSREVMHQATANIENIVNQTDIVKKQVIYWAIENSLLNTSTNDEVEHSLGTTTSAFIKNLRINFPFLSGVYIINEDGQLYSDTHIQLKENIAAEMMLKMSSSKNFEIIYPPLKKQYLGSQQSALIISFYKKIHDYNLEGKAGLIRVDVYFKALQSIIERIDLGDESRIYLINNDKRYTYGYDTSGNLLTAENLKNLETRNQYSIRDNPLVFRRNIQKSGWSLVGVIPVSNLKERIYRIRIISILIVIALSFLAVISGLFLANRITLPLTDVVDKIYRFGQGDFNQKLPHFNNHDLRILSENFNRMTSRIELLMTEAVEREKEKEKAELIALQAQINPHFLYNTLDVIRGISLQNNVPEVSSIVKSLACIFRYSINQKKESVSLSMELENIHHYLNVQEFRYIGRFELRESIPENLMTARVQRLILQPVIENIFKHVIEQRRDRTTIHLSARETEDEIILEIRNNGLGISHERLKEINSQLAGNAGALPADDNSTSIGLANVHRRLCMGNKNNRGLSIESSGEETAVKLFIKKETV